MQAAQVRKITNHLLILNIFKHFCFSKNDDIASMYRYIRYIIFPLTKRKKKKKFNLSHLYGIDAPM